MAVYQAL